MIDLRGQTILVTGGSRGIGAAIVRSLAEAGAHVLLHYGRNRKAAESVKASLSAARVDLIGADLAEPAEVDRLWAEATRLAPRIHVLVNNAGIFEPAPIEGTIEEWRAAWAKVIQVNLLAPADLCRAAILHFKQAGGGRIINVSSRAAFRGEQPDQWPYGASKGALVTMTKTIARGYARDNILAFGIAPGFTETEMVTGSLTEAEIARVVADIPLGEMAHSEEIGALTAFLCTPAVRHLTGATFDVNGASYVR